MNNLRISLIDLPHSSDDRGSFTKIFTNESINDSIRGATGNEISFEIKECYYSYSKKNVIRGMHFQIPPYDHHKIVHVIKGSILDVSLDVRKDSPTYGQFFAFNLSENKKQILFIPKGFAHGFCALEDSIVQYFQTTAYAPSSDAGIRYDSFNFPWNNNAPIVSNRDLAFPTLANFNSPF